MLAQRDEFHVAWFSIFLQVSAWMTLAIGMLYFVMGLFCLKRLRDKLVKEYRAKWKKYQEELKQFLEENGAEE
jgi:protein-S-isoprenylcysteine O-methyltransferase Ste14